MNHRRVLQSMQIMCLHDGEIQTKPTRICSPQCTYLAIWNHLEISCSNTMHFLCLCSKRVLLTGWVVSDLSTTVNSLKSNYSLLRKQRMVPPVKRTVTIPVSVGGLAHLNRYLRHSSDDEGLTPWSRFAATDISPCCGIILQKKFLKMWFSVVSVWLEMLFLSVSFFFSRRDSGYFFAPSFHPPFIVSFCSVCHISECLLNFSIVETSAQSQLVINDKI